MKNNQPITDVEYKFSDDERLISSTDTKGKIKYCNDAFVEVSGYSRNELIGKPHNIIRHPDMPSAVFNEMWQTLKAGNVWMGVVKNRRQSGDYYWVNAFVTPVFNGEEIIGYESVRINALEGEKERANKIYARLNQGKSATSMVEHIRAYSYRFMPLLGPGLIGLISLALLSGWKAAGLTFMCFLLSAVWYLVRNNAEWVEFSMLKKGAFTSQVVAQTFFNDKGVQASAKLAFYSEIARCRTALTRIEDATQSLSEVSLQTRSHADQTNLAIDHQNASTRIVASAVTQMSCAIQEVASNVQENAKQAELASLSVHDAVGLAGQSMQVINHLSESVSSIHNTVEALSDSTFEIQQAAELISAISEQTNLLALNAAIEAARAGEQGRGFSVVADEVRILALKTKESTETINQVAARVISRSETALSVSKKGLEHAEEGVVVVDLTKQSLDKINMAVKTISDMTIQMSSSVEEQSSVADHINQQIVEIADNSRSTKDVASQSLSASEELADTVDMVNSIIRRFSTD
ncbi:chemotaxis protein [Marinomonas sp. 42_23_T18]|nr:chemotaxis protein [Marinomonas sp. 42_23_T18]